MNQIQKQKEAYYKQQGIAPGVPTEKGAYGAMMLLQLGKTYELPGGKL